MPLQGREGVDGWQAKFLWKKPLHKGDDAALGLLIEARRREGAKRVGFCTYATRPEEELDRSSQGIPDGAWQAALPPAHHQPTADRHHARLRGPMHAPWVRRRLQDKVRQGGAANAREVLLHARRDFPSSRKIQTRARARARAKERRKKPPWFRPAEPAGGEHQSFRVSVGGLRKR